MNKIIIMGRLTKDPELKATQNGKQMCKFAVAVDNNNYSKRDKVDYFECVAWGNLGENIYKYFKKGRGILVEGAMHQNKVEKDNIVTTYWDLEVIDFNFLPTSRDASNTQTSTEN